MLCCYIRSSQIGQISPPPVLCPKVPSHPLAPVRKRMRNPNKKTIRVLKQTPKSPIKSSPPLPIPPLDLTPEPMDTIPTPQPTSSTDLTQKDRDVHSNSPIQSPMIADMHRDPSTITISSSPSPPHETPFSIESITRPPKTTLIPSPTSSHAPKEPPVLESPGSHRQSLLAPRTPTYLHPFFPYLQNSPLYTQYLEKQGGVPYPFYPIALSQQQIMNMYYSHLSQDKIAPPGPLPHMPITNIPLPGIPPELVATSGSRSRHKRADKTKRRHPPTDSAPSKSYKEESKPETEAQNPIYTPSTPDNC